jgi:hypothetical protein
MKTKEEYRESFTVLKGGELLATRPRSPYHRGKRRYKLLNKSKLLRFWALSIVLFLFKIHKVSGLDSVSIFRNVASWAQTIGPN